ncbi:MAG: hypothetical protein Q8Q04_03305 [archaeon]|nr:hypothetical protein [archaeon]
MKMEEEVYMICEIYSSFLSDSYLIEFEGVGDHEVIVHEDLITKLDEHSGLVKVTLVEEREKESRVHISNSWDQSQVWFDIANKNLIGLPSSKKFYIKD